jgi:hypothetical protein
MLRAMTLKFQKSYESLAVSLSLSGEYLED